MVVEKIKDIKSFSKMFGLNIPYYEHFDYYVEQLAKTERHKDIKELLLMFTELESELTHSLLPNSFGAKDMYEFRMSMMKEVSKFLKESHPYMEMTLDKNLLTLPSNRNFTYQEGVKYVSVDMVQTNWNSIKKYDQFNALGETYNDLLDKFDFPEVFRRSKSMRQFIFGNVNPALQQKVERNMMQEIVRQFSDDFDIECVRHDEVIFTFDDYSDLAPFLELDSNKWRLKIFTVERKMDSKLNTIYNHNGEELYKELVGVPGNLFYMRLKQHLTGEKLDIRDLYFRIDGKLAIWNTPDLKIEI